MAENGIAKVHYGNNNSLTVYEGGVVVSLAPETQWGVRSLEGGKVMLILQSDGTHPERALTLGEESTSDWTNVTIQELGSTPPDNQLWTLEESISTECLPPAVVARIQSVANPALSLSLGGDMILPRLYLGVVAVPNEKESDSQRWCLSYTSIE